MGRLERRSFSHQIEQLLLSLRLNDTACIYRPKIRLSFSRTAVGRTAIAAHAQEAFSPPPLAVGKVPGDAEPRPRLSRKALAPKHGDADDGRPGPLPPPPLGGAARPSQFCRRRRTLRRRGDTSVAASSGCVVARWLLIDTVMRSRDASPSRGPPANGMGLTLCQRSPPSLHTPIFCSSNACSFAVTLRRGVRLHLEEGRWKMLGDAYRANIMAGGFK